MTPDNTKRRGGFPVPVTAAQHMKDCGFLRLVTILLSVDDEGAQKLGHVAGLPSARCRFFSRP